MNELEDAISNPRGENRLERIGRNGKWDKVWESPRQSMSPLSDKSPGFRGNPMKRTDSVFSNKILQGRDLVPVGMKSFSLGKGGFARGLQSVRLS